MSPSRSAAASEALKTTALELIEQLPYVKHGKWIQQALETVLRLTTEEVERLDWKILAASLQDLERGFQVFRPYRHIRKVAVFGSARLPSDSPEYEAAKQFSRRLAADGFMAITGSGGGIMQAGNEGAGTDRSFGLNIQLPFEQTANPFIDGDDKLIDFKYFFTRKLFFLRESDAIAFFPGGFGTQDEAFECLTLCQTGRFGPAPIVLVDRPGGNYWQAWERYVRDYLLQQGLIGPDDTSLYEITDQVEEACQIIERFYRIYHSSRYVGDRFVIRLKREIPDEVVDCLNEQFSNILVRDRIRKTEALPQESGDETESLPRLVFYFDQRHSGRLHQLIDALNELGCNALPGQDRPCEK